MDDLAVEIGEDAFFGIEVDVEIRIIGMERSNKELGYVVLAEAVERRERACASAIECSLDRDNATHGVVLHIVGKNHQLGDVDKSAELFVRETFAIHARAFGHHAAVIVRLFHLYETERQSVDKKSDVGAKFVLTISASKFGSKMKSVVSYIIKIN